MLIKVIFVIPSLRAGGAERVMSFLAQNINKKIFEAHLLIIESSKDSTYTIQGIKVHYLNKKKVRNSIPAVISYFSEEKPHIVLSAIAHLNTMMALLSPFFPQIKFIGRETTISGIKKPSNLLTKLLRPLFQLTPKLLDCTICQSEDMRNDLQERYNYSDGKLITINNPIAKKFSLKKVANKNTTIEFITVGRLVPNKGYKRIIKAISKLDIPYRYTIIGSGTQIDEIMSDINSYDMTAKVRHIPHTDKVEVFLSESNLFLSGSYVDGFPNAFIESCAVGTPVLAYNAKGGINEIIKSGVNGFIANDEEDFIEKLEISIKKHWDPKKVRESVINRYDESIILRQYEDLFLSLVK